MNLHSLELSRLYRSGLVAAFVISGALGHASAHGVTAGEIEIDHPYAQPSRSGVNNGAVYFKRIGNRGATADRLVSARSPAADAVEIHNMKIVDGVMRMRAIAGVEVPAGGTVDMSKGNPEGYHVMLLRLSKPLVERDRFPLTLQFERAGAIDVEVVVEATPSDAPMQHQGDHEAMKSDHGAMKADHGDHDAMKGDHGKMK